LTWRLIALGLQPTWLAAAARLPRSTIDTRVDRKARFMRFSHLTFENISIFLF
jgi:hypothetical protein